ncbi:MAG: VWA domain-containing protein [Clostridia bacterium]|nr:VWA domain-containing protein [Clostridia bacterium]
MRNISFDNPYWLLLAIPLAAALLIPYFISVSKDNRNKGWIASLVIHILIIISVSLAAAGLVHTTVMTSTKVYVVADVSYSSNRNLDEIDEYIQQIKENLPSNASMGVVCFGKNAELLSSASDNNIKSVKESKVDDSETDIVGALEYTRKLFGFGEIKRIVLITDGFVTTGNGSVAATVSRFVAEGIKIDAVYLDNSLDEGDGEIQISDVEYTGSTYLNHESSLGVLIESSMDNEVILDLYAKKADENSYSKINTTEFKAGEGMNIVSFDLPTDTAGDFDYKVELKASKDTSEHNNSFYFTQTVAGQRSILLITEKQSDVSAINELYGAEAKIDSYLVRGEGASVPYTIEDIVKYDEIILSNVDIRKINHIYAFIDSVDLAVSQYGKSLITLGDLSMQNQDDDRFDLLEELLPISFGNSNKDAKLYTIIIDISRSMDYHRPRQLLAAKDAATELLSILNDDDYVAFVTLAGEARIELTPTRLGDCREELYNMIQGAESSQGTFVGEALKMAYSHIKDLNFEEKQVMLISDGKQYENEATDSKEIAAMMKDDGITLSTISMLNHNIGAKCEAGCELLKELAELGGGVNYDFVDESKITELVFADIADNLLESVVEKQTKVNIEARRDETVEGIFSLPDVYGYMNSKPKLDATMVLSVDYQKSSTKTVAVPLYSYRDHGNGRVSSFTSSLSGDWLSGWSDEVKADLFGKILSTNTPREYVNYPFTIGVESEFDKTRVEIIPSSINMKAKAKILVFNPDGSAVEEDMVFDLNRYYATIDTPETGRYQIEITYTYGDHSFTGKSYFTRQYGDEYDAFASYDIVNLHNFMRGFGQVSRDGNINLENDKNEVQTYELSFRTPLLIAAVALFVIDVVIRKFKWADIKGLFVRRRKEGIAK